MQALCPVWNWIFANIWDLKRLEKADMMRSMLFCHILHNCLSCTEKWVSFAMDGLPQSTKMCGQVWMVAMASSLVVEIKDLKEFAQFGLQKRLSVLAALCEEGAGALGFNTMESG